MTKIVLNLINPENYLKNIVRLLKEKTESHNVVYLTTNKTYSFLTEILKKNKIPVEKIFFIDCISIHIGEKIKENLPNCFYLESPGSLTKISMTLNEVVSSISGEKTLLIDSLSLLSIYNDSRSLTKFSNFVMGKMRSAGVETIILALEKDLEKEIIRQVESISDEVIK